ncbi:MAG: polysaccharide deacetylase family protein [Myxococcales bacterium]|nr:polysaccharide deacetylase family protein [Myxococcales bacterium]
MLRALRALRIVPWTAQAKVAALIVLMVTALLLPWWYVTAYWPLWLLAEGLLTGALLYLLWCRIPLGYLLIPTELQGKLPQPEGQPLLLSFDDGPTEGLTDRVLDLLRAHGVRASFFVLLAKAERHPALIRRIVSEGHLLGIHGEDHRLPLGRSRIELRESLRSCQEQLSQWTGQPVQLFRPSHGVRTRALLAALRDTGLRLCLWDHGVWDTDAPDPQTLLWRMRAVWSLGEKAGRPRVLLLHDGRGDELGPPPHTDSLLLALAELLPELARHIPSRSQQLPLRAMDAPDLAEVGHDVAQIRDLRVT